MEPGPALVVERLGHERGQQPPVPGDLLHRRLEPERAVRGVRQVRVAEVDLELAGCRTRGWPRSPAVPRRAAAAACQAARPAGHPCGRPRRRCRVRWRNAATPRPVPARTGRTRARARRPGCSPRPAACPATRWATTRGDSGAAAPSGVTASPMHQAARGSHGSGVTVARSGNTVMSGRPTLQAALDRHHVAHGRGVIDGPAEREPVPGRRRQFLEQHVTAAVHADHVGVATPGRRRTPRPAGARKRQPLPASERLAARRPPGGTNVRCKICRSSEIHGRGGKPFPDVARPGFSRVPGRTRLPHAAVAPSMALAAITAASDHPEDLPCLTSPALVPGSSGAD